MIHHDGSKPIYVQISDWIETEILRGNFEPDQKVYSQYQLAEMFNINPATAAKGLNVLANEMILYKKRGLGLFVASDARERIVNRRKNETLKQLVVNVVMEAKYLQVSETVLVEMIHNVYNEIKEDGS
ncbi:GntR family transcriptional regulator [Alkalihalobacillus sp. MEB130]|uniref:GntR family transcriptional regulator n=1 Tax=Alkalihalobacillus sp. MEB130 TaxID=2976704 RepID=UPI0028DD54F0|nr:GntR family transcriptional regulator [Alkalihalobacillus sp. MEB130]MDT8861593.1 GntR family transcriptional regulator [Alkalihalobacillus sp. MEB130]